MQFSLKTQPWRFQTIICYLLFRSKKGLTTRREFLYTKLCPEKSHPLWGQIFPKPVTTFWKTLYTNPLAMLIFSSLAWYIPVVFFGTLSPTLLDCHPAMKLLNHVTCHTLYADWLALHVKFGDCNPPETFYHIVSPIYPPNNFCYWWF